MDKWIKDTIHRIKGLKLLPNDDIKITHNDREGKIAIDILNHGSPKYLELSGFGKEEQYNSNKKAFEDWINSIKPLIFGYLAKEKKIINKNSLIIQNLKKASFEIKKEFTYKIFHDKIDKDGDFIIKIKVSYELFSKEVKCQLKVFEINKSLENILDRKDDEVDIDSSGANISLIQLPTGGNDSTPTDADPKPVDDDAGGGKNANEIGGATDTGGDQNSKADDTLNNGDDATDIAKLSTTATNSDVSATDTGGASCTVDDANDGDSNRNKVG